MAEVIFHPDGITNRVKVVAGEIALDGSNPTDVNVAGKLSTIVSVSVSLLNATAPGTGMSTVTYSKSGTVVSFYAWKPTATADTALVASTDTETVSYQIIGY